MRVYVQSSACRSDHGACLGRCNTRHVPDALQLIEIDLPESMVDALEGKHFHIDLQHAHFVIRDYDCRFVQRDTDLELAMLRFGADLMEQQYAIGLATEPTMSWDELNERLERATGLGPQQ
jgi:hypothetical protein